MKDYTDSELAELADWAENQDRQNPSPEAKKGYGAVRQGVDWLLRWRARERQTQLDNSDKPQQSARKQ